ncbi:hypothetical protein ACA081_00540 [Candidatus Hodgkinia cicadicola]
MSINEGDGRTKGYNKKPSKHSVLSLLSNFCLEEGMLPLPSIGNYRIIITRKNIQ